MQTAKHISGGGKKVFWVEKHLQPILTFGEFFYQHFWGVLGKAYVELYVVHKLLMNVKKKIAYYR